MVELLLTPELINLQQQAWMLRGNNFPPSIQFDYPTATKVVRVTGDYCALDCAHCGGHYLKKMLPLKQVLDQVSQNPTRGEGLIDFTSCLVSGACDEQGRVPVMDNFHQLKVLKEKYKINMHVGLIGEEDIASLAEIAHVVSFDFVTHQETITEVYGLGKTGADYLSCYRQLREHVKVLPHICIGLKGGEIAGEYQALKVLQQEGVTGLVFIVFIPTKGTRYADRQPPPLAEVIKLLATARIMFPHQPIHLGCMRPGGRYRTLLDQWAIKCGVNKIVMPTKQGRATAAELGLEIIKGQECCVL